MKKKIEILNDIFQKLDPNVKYSIEDLHKMISGVTDINKFGQIRDAISRKKNVLPANHFNEWYGWEWQATLYNHDIEGYRSFFIELPIGVFSVSDLCERAKKFPKNLPYLSFIGHGLQGNKEQKWTASKWNAKAKKGLRWWYMEAVKNNG